MNDWLIWFGIYLLAGALVIMLVRVVVKYQESHKAKNSDFVRDMLAVARSLEPKKSFAERSAELAAYGLIVVIWPLIPVVLGIDKLIKKYRKEPNMLFEEPKIIEGKTTFEEGCWPEQLQEEVSVDLVAENHLIHDPLNRVPAVPFGFLNGAWLEFISKIQPGDTVHRFEIKEGEPCGLYGYKSREYVSGYAVRRNGLVVEQFQFEFE